MTSPADIRIEVLQPEQIAAAVRVLTRAFNETKPSQKKRFTQHLRGSGVQHFHAVVAMRDTRVVGVATMGPGTLNELPASKLHNLAVDPQWQDKGIGRRMMEYVEDLVSTECLNGKPGFIRLFNLNPFRGAKFYRSLGYVPADPDIRDLMCKPLNGAPPPGRKRL
jgi:predicted N-acetyltransferase YhbS